MEIKLQLRDLNLWLEKKPLGNKDSNTDYNDKGNKSLVRYPLPYNIVTFMLNRTENFGLSEKKYLYYLKKKYVGVAITMNIITNCQHLPIIRISKFLLDTYFSLRYFEQFVISVLNIYFMAHNIKSNYKFELTNN